MNKADKYFKELLQDIDKNGTWSKKPRTRWSSDTPAQYKSVYGKEYVYDISKGEFPITTLRNTAHRGCFEEMKWIYILQSNIIEDAHKSIHKWWVDFVTETQVESYIGNNAIWTTERNLELIFEAIDKPLIKEDVLTGKVRRTIGATYGKVIRRYDLMNKLLNNLENNPESRRNMINLWDNQCQMEDPKALPPCVYLNKWVIRRGLTDGFVAPNGSIIKEEVNYLDLTLNQRSRDVLLTYSINPEEYVMLQMMIANHLTWKTGTLHRPGFLRHKVDDEHVYDRNYWAVEELLEREPTGLQPTIRLTCPPKNFYEHTWEDFEITGLEGIKKLDKKLEIAI